MPKRFDTVDPNSGNADGPYPVANTWVVSAVERGDLRAVWHLTDVTFRLALAQAWIWLEERAAPDDELAGSISGDDGPSHALFDAFQAWVSGVLLREFGFERFDSRTWGPVNVVRPVGIDLEVVTYVSSEDAGGWQVDHEITVDAAPVLMRKTHHGWLVAGLSEHAPEPGWPPMVRRLSD